MLSSSLLERPHTSWSPPKPVAVGDFDDDLGLGQDLPRILRTPRTAGPNPTGGDGVLGVLEGEWGSVLWSDGDPDRGVGPREQATIKHWPELSEVPRSERLGFLRHLGFLGAAEVPNRDVSSAFVSIISLGGTKRRRGRPSTVPTSTAPWRPSGRAPDRGPEPPPPLRSMRAAMWEYVDPMGKVQGKFSTDQMRYWFQNGMFGDPEDLAVRCTSQGTFVPVEELYPPPGRPFTMLPPLEAPEPADPAAGRRRRRRGSHRESAAQSKPRHPQPWPPPRLQLKKLPPELSNFELWHQRQRQTAKTLRWEVLPPSRELSKGLQTRIEQRLREALQQAGIVCEIKPESQGALYLTNLDAEHVQRFKSLRLRLVSELVQMIQGGREWVSVEQSRSIVSRPLEPSQASDGTKLTGDVLSGLKDAFSISRKRVVSDADAPR
mmetsp:Transcript_80130/g.183598  ORF Transcript_80130/g.183598 Transcript_80130/m.183598 type:complete len:434 (+) Transcript_80130:1-1302(+)